MAWVERRIHFGMGEGVRQIGRRVEEGRKKGTVVGGTGLTVSIRWNHWWDRLWARVKRLLGKAM
jgi:hypothetical protein